MSIENLSRPGKEIVVSNETDAFKLAYAQMNVLLSKYQQLRINLVKKPQTMMFSNGWRFIYDVFLGAFRVRQTVLMLFVDKQGEVIEEWNDIEDVLDQLKLIIPNQANPPVLQDAISTAQEQHPNKTIETVEVVWDPKAAKQNNNEAEAKPLLGWRLGLRQGVERSVVTVYQTGDKPVIYSARAQTKYAASRSRTRWQLGNKAVRLRSNGTISHLIVDVNKFSPILSGVNSAHWIIWSCIARTAQFIQELGYGDIGLHKVIVEFNLDADPNASSASSEKGDLPIISFPSKGAWAEDITIIIHELGHAFWNLMFTRLPKQINFVRFLQNAGTSTPEKSKQYFDAAQQGIQEGFADYFAASVLANDTPKIRIGTHVAQILGKENQFNLPREINGKPRIPSIHAEQPIEEHAIGWQWANFLWDVRQQLITHKIEVNTITQQIIESHLRPKSDADSPAEPLACYFLSLQQTIGQTAYDLSWENLAQQHGIQVKPLPRTGRGRSLNITQ